MKNQDIYRKEAEEQWGDTEAHKQSQEKLKTMTKEELENIQKESEALTQEIADCMNEDVRSEKVQKLIERHFNNLRKFYEPNIEMYRGLAKMYSEDPRFSNYFEKHAKGLTKFMKEAMLTYCEKQ